MQIQRERWLERRQQRWERGYNSLDPVVQELALHDDSAQRRELRLAVIAAVVLHVAALFVVIPSSEPRLLGGGGRQVKVFRLKQVRFQPPKASPRQAVARPKVKRIPIPDPTPDDPEPVFDKELLDVPPLDYSTELGSSTSAVIPPVPPGSVGLGGPGNAMEITGNVVPPKRVFAPEPVYPEDARQAHVQGVVVLETIIDTLGQVKNIKVLKGLPLGLSEAAAAAVAQWRFKPALLEDKPVAVYYMVTISFSLQ